MKFKILTEMATNRQDAMNRCLNLGPNFIKHFHKAYQEGVKNINFHHHCTEMKSWWDKVKGIRLKPDNKKLSLINYIDWFFTAGGALSDYGIDDQEEIIYSDLILNLYKNFDLNIEEYLSQIV